MSTKTKKGSVTRLLLLVAGLLLLVKFILENSVSIGSFSLTGIFTFLAMLFILIIVIGFYIYFAFFAPGYGSAFKALIPIVLLLAVFGEASMNFYNDTVNQVLTSIASVIWVLMIVTGFVFLFVRKKILGMTFGISALVYACFTIASYIVALIMTLVDGGSFSVENLFITLFFCAALTLVFCGTYIGLRRREWLD